MIIRNNLASSPARNYSLYLIGCIVLAIIGTLLTIYNVFAFSSWFGQSRALGREMAEQQKQISNLKHQEAELRSQILQVKTLDFITKTDFVNNAIKRRVFSWTRLFDQFERAFPDNVKMVSVSPTILGDKINISMEVAGHSLENIVQLITVLQNSPAFADVTFRSERSNEPDGLLHATISLEYRPEKATPTGSASQSTTSPGTSGMSQTAPAVQQTPQKDEVQDQTDDDEEQTQ